jgi:nucleotide-binding universal stress UspA family protein
MDYGGFAPITVSYEAENQGAQHWESELQSFLEPLTRKAEGISVKTNVVERLNVREAILEEVVEKHIDLVVLGTRGKSNLRTLLIGTTAERIVQHVPSSILAVKPDEVVEAAIQS